MKNNLTTPFFSVVIPTRNRPELFKLALDSVLSQSFDSFEIIVVIDGSTKECLHEYKELQKSCNENVSFHELVHRPNGHGQSYSMNYGVSKARGEYICFLDDDDYWIDTEHLSRAHSSITDSNVVVDAYYSNQDAYFSDGKKQEKNVWIEDLRELVLDRSKDNEGSYNVDVELLIQSGGFAHLNCSIVRKSLYDDIGGMDEDIRYECDRDIYIRVIDAADRILYNPMVISKHHIPDTTKSDNMSTLISFAEKSIYQLRVYDKGIVSCKNQNLANHCVLGKMYVLKNLTQAYVNLNEYKKASYFSRQALGVKFSIKWALFTIYLAIK